MVAALKRRSEIIYRRVLLSLLQRNHEVNLRKGYPRFCVRPGDVIGDDIILDGLYEEDLLVQLFSDIFRKFDGRFKESTALDIGANIGNHSLFISRYFAEVYAFEPNETSLHILRANILINQVENVKVFDFGLGDRCENVTFVEHPDSLGMSHFVDRGHQEGRRGATPQIMRRYRVQRGDDVLESEKDISLVKVDCEGYEVPALRGLRETLSRHRPLVLFESCSSEGPSGSRAIMALLKEMGYAHFYMYEWRSTNRAVVALTRMRRELRPIDEPSDRYHSLLIASPEDLGG